MSVVPPDPSLTRSLTPEQSRDALQRYVESVAFRTPPAEGVPPDPDAGKLEAEDAEA